MEELSTVNKLFQLFFMDFILYDLFIVYCKDMVFENVTINNSANKRFRLNTEL